MLVGATLTQTSQAIKYQENIDEAAISQTLAQIQSQSSVEAQNPKKVAKFARIAWKKLKPAMASVKKLAGPNYEQFLGMTPVGNYLGIGAPGSYDKLR